jgi:hypothetical protein
MAKSVKPAKDLLDQILSRRHRSAPEYGYFDVVSKLEALDQLARLARSTDMEALRLELLCHLPIALIALLETIFRKGVEQLVRMGEPYSTRAAALAKPELGPLNLPLLLEMPKRKVTPSELFAHLLPFSRFDHFLGPLQSLLERDFLGLCADPDHLGRLVEPIDKQAMWRELPKLFEYRHMFCHEVPKNRHWNEEEVLKAYEVGRAFAVTSSWALLKIIDPDVDLSNVELTNKAWNEASKTKEVMDRLLSRAIDGLEEPLKGLLLEQQSLWERIMTIEAKMIGIKFEGGTGTGFATAMRNREFMESRIKALRFEFTVNDQDSDE